MADDINKRIQQFVGLRDARRVLKKQFEKSDGDLRLLQDRVAGHLQKFLGDNNLQNLKTDSGTCYITTRFTASLADPDAFMRFVIENEKFELLDRKANATAVKAYVKANNVQPPGCNLTAIQKVGVKRGDGADDDE